MCNSSLVFVKKLCVHIFCLVFFFFSILTIVVIYAATWVNFEPKLRKKIHPEKKFLYFNGTFVPALPPPPPPPPPHNSLAPLGETGYLSNLYYLVATQASGFLKSFFVTFGTVTTLISFFVTFGTPC